MDLLLHRYGDVEFIMNLDIADGVELIKKAFQSDVEDKLWQQWLFEHLFMTKENFMSFEDYRNQVIDKPVETTNISAKEIIKNAERIKKIDQINLEGR